MQISIIMPVHNELEYTKKCIDSIKKNSGNIEFEIIIIDNASEDGTKDFLKKETVKYIYNKENIGVARSWNQGINIATGEYLCIINNDILVCKNWLTSLVQVYNSIKNAGIISPATREGELNYDFETYSEKFIKKMKNIKEKGFSGWCMCIKKDRFLNAGFFSEEFNTGIGEDTDFYLRLKKKRYESYITGAVFIHHFGSRTLKRVKEKTGNYFEIENIQKLNNKWNIKKENYVKRKIKNFIKFLKNLYFKIFYGHNLLEKSNYKNTVS